MSYTVLQLTIYLLGTTATGFFWFLVRRTRWGPIVMVVLIGLIINLAWQFFRSDTYRCEPCMRLISGTYVLTNSSAQSQPLTRATLIQLSSNGSYHVLKDGVWATSRTGTWNFDRLPDIDIGSFVDSTGYRTMFYWKEPDTLFLEAPMLFSGKDQGHWCLVRQ